MKIENEIYPVRWDYEISLHLLSFKKKKSYMLGLYLKCLLVVNYIVYNLFIMTKVADLLK